MLIRNLSNFPSSFFLSHAICLPGEPRDINRDNNVKSRINCPHVTFVNVLVQNQFPGEYFLPDYRGILSISAPFSDRWGPHSSFNLHHIISCTCQ